MCVHNEHVKYVKRHKTVNDKNCFIDFQLEMTQLRRKAASEAVGKRMMHHYTIKWSELAQKESASDNDPSITFFFAIDVNRLNLNLIIKML